LLSEPKQQGQRTGIPSESGKRSEACDMNRNNRNLNERDAVTLLVRYGVTARPAWTRQAHRSAMRQEGHDRDQRAPEFGDPWSSSVSDYCHKRYPDQDRDAQGCARSQRHALRASVAVGLAKLARAAPPEAARAHQRAGGRPEAFMGLQARDPLRLGIAPGLSMRA
jgi:hypothetical protein